MKKLSNIEIAMEAQAALAMRNHQLVVQLNEARNEIDRLRNELEMRPPPCDLLEERNRADRAEMKLARLRAGRKTARRGK